MTRFLVTSDPQIGAHPDYGRNGGDRLADDEAVWTRTLDLAVEHKVDGVLHGGDAFQHRRPTPAHLMAFQRPLLAFLAEHDIPVLAINGNHDVESPILPSSLELFEPVIDVHTEPGIWTPSGNLYTPGEVAVVTLPWVPMSRMRTLMAEREGRVDGEEVNALAAALLVEAARELRAQVDGPAILLAHWHVDVAVAMSGMAASEIFREPLLCMADLEAIGFDAMAFAHNHRMQTVGRNAFHISSPQPVDFGESLSEHGVWIVDVGDGETVTTFVPVESRPFVTLDYDLTIDPEAWGAITLNAMVADADVTDAVVRVRYRATDEQARRIDQGEIRRALFDAGAHNVWQIHCDPIRENRARAEHVTEDIAPLEAVKAWADANDLSGEQHQQLADLTTELLQEIGA